MCSQAKAPAAPMETDEATTEKLTQVVLGSKYSYEGIPGRAVYRRQHYSGCFSVCIQPPAKKGATALPKLIEFSERIALGLETPKKFHQYNPGPRHVALGKQCVVTETGVKGKCISMITRWPEGTNHFEIRERKNQSLTGEEISHIVHENEFTYEGQTEEQIAATAEQPPSPINAGLGQSMYG